jgi:hypothetical protein
MQLGRTSVPFGSTGCDKCRKERLHHGHRVRFEDDNMSPTSKPVLPNAG